MPMGSFAPAFSAGPLGATIGALTFGALCDRFGRKRMLVLMSVFTFLTAVVGSFSELRAVRFCGGLGFEGTTPCLITLAAEYAPKRRRAMLATILSAAYPLGASAGGLSTAALLVGLNNFVGVAGMASAGRLVERFGPLALVPAFGLGAAILAIMGLVASSASLSAICMALLGLTVLLGASGGIALAATSYPTAIRSTGVGRAMGMARFGQVCSPLLVGLMLHLDWSAARILGMMATPPVLAAVFCLLRTMRERRTIEQA